MCGWLSLPASAASARNALCIMRSVCGLMFSSNRNTLTSTEPFALRMPHADSDRTGEPRQHVASRSAQAGSAFDPGSGVLTRGLDRRVFGDLRSRAGVDEAVAFVHG